MQINILQKDFLEGLKNIQTIVEKRTTLPILNNFLLSTKENAIEISATDLEIEYKGFYPARVIKPGAITIPTKKSFEIVRELFKTNITLSTEEYRVKIEGGKSVFNIPGLPSEDFPKFSIKEPFISFDLETGILKDMINKTIFATSQEESRSTLSGVLLSLKPGNISLIATDGYRLAFVKRELEMSGLGKNIDVVIPRKVLSEVRKIFADSQEKLVLGLQENGIVFKRDNIVISCRLLEGDFPDYKQVIPEKSEKKVVLKREDFSQTLRRVSLLSDEESKLFTVKVLPNKIELLARTPEFGEARDEIEATYSGEELEICLNARYILECLSTYEDEFIVFDLEDTAAPIVIRPLEEQYCFNVIMPMSIEQSY